jgi:cellulose biosynthesis protein BcsQ
MIPMARTTRNYFARLRVAARRTKSDARPRLEARRLRRGIEVGSSVASPAMRASQRQVIAVVSNKGGVGKTTVATNLAIALRALHEDLPILLVTLDDQSGIERMFRIGEARSGARTLRDAFMQRSFAGVAELGQFGVHFVPAASDLEALKARAAEPFTLRRMLEASGWSGLVVLDTKSDLEALTRSALAACDLAVLPVADRASLDEAAKAFDLMGEGRATRGRVLFTLVDRRTKLDAEGRDLYERLAEQAEARGWPRFAAYLSRSPRVEAINSGAARPRSILHEAKGTLAHKQLRELAEEASKLLGLGESAAANAAHASGPTPPRSEPPRAPRDFAADLRGALFRGLRGR